MEDKVKNIAIEIVDKISNLPQDTEFVIGDYFKDYNLESKEKFEVIKEVLSVCESKNIIIENTQEGMTLGMPWVYTFKRKN